MHYDIINFYFIVNIFSLSHSISPGSFYKIMTIEICDASIYIDPLVAMLGISE